MYDELIKDLRESAPKALAEADFDFVEGWLKEAADVIEELSKDRDKWKATAQEERDAYRHWFNQYQKDAPSWIPVAEEHDGEV